MDDILQYDIDILETEARGEEIGENATVSTSDDAVEVIPLDAEATPTETIEYIMVEEPEEIVVDVDEAFVGTNGVVMPQHTHSIGDIERLESVLNTLGSITDTYSIHSGFAEFRQWLDDGYYDENYTTSGGVGYFVSLVTSNSSIDGNNTYIDICRKKNDDGTVETMDVYGVTVSNSGFYGYQDVNYNLLDSQSPNRADNPKYAKVCLLGNVKVRVSAEEHLNIKTGDYIIPNELGYAQKSENSVGFKVISKGQIESVGDTTTSWYYVEIALVPQNDNIARVMKKIEDAQVDLEGITIQLGGISDKITDIEGSGIQLGKDFEGLKDLVNESTNKIDTQLPIIEQKLQDAVEDVVYEANKTINDMTLEYTEAVSKSREALEKVDGALLDVEELQKNVQPLATWKSGDGASFGTAGFLAQAEKDHTELSSLTSAFSENGTDLTAIIQKIDSNGAAIQHIVSHIDKYTLGAHSPAYGLSAEEIYILQPGHIYVPTENHNDEDSYVNPPIEFTLGKSYEWKNVENTDTYMWAEYKDVSTSTEEINGKEDGDLWYCWQGVFDESGKRYSYNPQTLYCWDNKKRLWVAVASVNDNSTARVTGLIRQTADELMSVYTDLEGNVSDIRQTVNGIDTRVATAEGEISQIHQTAEDITLGVYDPEQGSTSLGLLLNGMQSTSNYGGRVCIKHIVDSSPITSNRYKQSPMWDGEKFVFVEDTLVEDGIYYPYPNDDTKYCKIVSGGYEVYTIGNEATALLRTDVDNNKSAIEGLTTFKTDTSKTLTALQSQSDANSAKIASVATGEYVVCSDINLNPTEADLDKIPTIRYKNPPTWEDDGFVFDKGDKDSNGIYCMFADDTDRYYKLLFNIENTIVGYEQYELASSGSASIMQMVTEQGSSIGMIVDNNGVKGAVLVEAINEQSTATISADKIDLISYAKLKDVENVDKELKTLISQTAEGINLNVSEKLKGYSTTEEMNSAISVKANEINLSVSQSKQEAITEAGKLADDAETNANEYTDNKIAVVDKRMSSIEQDAEGIKLSVTEVGEKFSNYSTTDEMNDAIEEVESNAQAYTNNQLVNYAKTSEITQLADKISMVVTETESGNTINTASIIAEINEGSSKISMNAVDIDLTGYVTFNSLTQEGQTTINGSNITTGIIKSGNYVVPTKESIFAQSGTKFDLSNGTINSTNFNINADGDVDINGNVNIGGSINMDGDITLGGSIDIQGDLVFGGNNSIVKWRNSDDSAFITGNNIYSPNITGGTINGGIFHATGIGNEDFTESAYYIWDNDVLKGYISYDNGGVGSNDDAKNRMFVTTVGGTALKIHSSSNMSISTDVGDGGTIFITSDEIRFGNVVSDDGDTESPNIFVNSMRLATQDWVNKNGGGIDPSNLKITFG